MAFAPLPDYHCWHMLIVFTLPLTIESTKNRGLWCSNLLLLHKKIGGISAETSQAVHLPHHSE
jgi:hypothetical protein